MVEITLTQKECTHALSELKRMIRTDRNEIYTIHFEADYANAKIIRDFVGAIFDAHKIYRPWRGRFILITDELINNAIEHGSTPGDMDSCTIEAGKTENGDFSIRFEVHDTGKGKHGK